jgi:hypothetical protein
MSVLNEKMIGWDGNGKGPRGADQQQQRQQVWKREAIM